MAGWPAIGRAARADGNQVVIVGYGDVLGRAASGSGDFITAVCDLRHPLSWVTRPLASITSADLGPLGAACRGTGERSLTPRYPLSDEERTVLELVEAVARNRIVAACGDGPKTPKTREDIDDMDQRAREAMALFQAGQFESAERAWRALLRDHERHLGPDHPDTIGTCNELGSTLFRLRRFTESADMHREAHRRASKAVGPQHPDTLWYAHNLGNALLAGGEVPAAISVLDETARDMRKALGKAHADTLGTVKSLGVALFMFGDARRSREVLESAYQTAAQSFGASDPLAEEIAQNLDIVRRNS